VGFVADVGVAELCTLGVPVIDDAGSGALATLPELADEPDVPASVAAGAAVVCFSGDKLLGGPQAGILLGTREAIGACRRHPLARAMRVGRLPLAALAATLALYRDPARALREIPVLAMLAATPGDLARRADALARATDGGVVASVARVGGGALPLLDLHGPAVSLPDDPEPLARALRLGDPAVVARIADGRVLLDPRTLRDDETSVVAAAVAAARLRIRGGGPG
jgi:L-seryl-tRNA(Ser) seleniumtransferase